LFPLKWSHAISRQLQEEFWWLRVSSGVFTSAKKEDDERLIVQAAVDEVAWVIWKSRTASGSQGSKLSIATSSQELHGLCEVPSFNTFTLATWLLLKQAQRNPHVGVGRLEPRVQNCHTISNIPKH
jgi:hypothetical protein